jgi:T1SS-143 domain-containing protein
LISTGVLGAIEIEFNDGSIMTLGRNSQVMLNDETFNFAESQQAESLQISENADVESIQQAILGGDDPTQTTQATAAGAGVESSNEGVDFVQVDYEKPEMIPEAGFDTTGISFTFEEEFIDEGATDDSNSLLANQLDDVPSAGTTILLLDEDDLSGVVASDYVDIDTAFELSTGLIARPATKNGNNDLSSGDDVAQNSSTILSGNLDIDFGDDGAGDITFNAGNTQPQGITSNGVEIEYWVSEDGHTLIGFIPTGINTVDVIFTAEITNPQTGAFIASLYGSVDHENSGSTTEENLAIDLGFTITDVDSDPAQGVLRFDIDDEIPVIGSAQDAPEPSIVDEEGLINGNIDDGYSGDGAGADLTTNGNLNISWGADDGDARTVTFSSSMVGSTSLTSDDESITYSLSQEGTLLTATAGSRTVFTVELSKDGQGSYEFTLLDNLDHPTTDTEDDIDLVFNFVATDADGDTASANFMVTVDDDAPKVNIINSSDKDYTFTLSNFDHVSSAGYKTSYGYYIKDEQGNPSRGVIVEDNVKNRDGIFENPETIFGFSPEEVGFFIIPHGGRLNRSTVEDGEEVTFQFVNGEWQAFTLDGVGLKGADSKVLFDVAELNKDGQDHLIDNQLIGNQNWEDLNIPSGDGDYNDVNTNVTWTEVSVSGQSVDSVSFGADGGKSLDFTFDDNDIFVSGVISSNGKNISFSAKDSDNDGFNDQIVGLTDDDTEVLLIEGVLDGEYNVSILREIDEYNSDASVDIFAQVSATDADGDTTYQDLSININVDINHLVATTSVIDP